MSLFNLFKRKPEIKYPKRGHTVKNVNDVIELQKQDVQVVKCEQCGALMVNIAPEKVEKGDLLTLKRLELTLTNPKTKDQICLDCELKREAEEKAFKSKVNTYMNTPKKEEKDDDNDSHLFTPSSVSSHNNNDDDSSSGGGFSFGGFGGGMFSGGGATGSW